MKIYVITSVDGKVYIGTYLSAGDIPTHIFTRCFDSISTDLTDRFGEVIQKQEFYCHHVELPSKETT